MTQEGYNCDIPGYLSQLPQQTMCAIEGMPLWYLSLARVPRICTLVWHPRRGGWCRSVWRKANATLSRCARSQLESKYVHGNSPGDGRKDRPHLKSRKPNPAYYETYYSLVSLLT